MIFRLIFVLLMFFSSLSAKELFLPKDIHTFLTQDNPYVYSIIADEQIAMAQITRQEGGLDTKLNAAYENKDYPLSESEFATVGLKKPTESGVELLLDYRRAEGTQEYNNVKTGDEGEYRIGINLPLFAMFQGVNERKYKLNSARINAQYTNATVQDKLRLLYNQSIQAYYTLLYFHEGVTLEKQLLEKAQKRDSFIKKRVSTGDLPELSRLESTQQLISRQQRLISAENNYAQSLENFLQLLNLPRAQFDTLYALPSLMSFNQEAITLESALEYALQNRPDLLALEKQLRQLELDATYNSISQVPTFDLFAYGMHDPIYGEGAKAGFNLEIPLEQRSFEGQQLTQQKRTMQITAEKKKRVLSLTAQLRNLFATQEALMKNIQLVQTEVSITQRLEVAENKKYEFGSSDLFQVNQREMQVIAVKQKQLNYMLEKLKISQEINKEMGKMGEFGN